MDKRIHRLETFTARGSDGKTYSVHGYEHQRRLDAFSADAGQWEPTGVAEYKLPDGRHVDLADDGTLVVAGSDLRLKRETGTVH
jgi:hypothetical protein